MRAAPSSTLTLWRRSGPGNSATSPIQPCRGFRQACLDSKWPVELVRANRQVGRFEPVRRPRSSLCFQARHDAGFSHEIEPVSRDPVASGSIQRGSELCLQLHAGGTGHAGESQRTDPQGVTLRLVRPGRPIAPREPADPLVRVAGRSGHCRRSGPAGLRRARRGEAPFPSADSRQLPACCGVSPTTRRVSAPSTASKRGATIIKAEASLSAVACIEPSNCAARYLRRARPASTVMLSLPPRSRARSSSSRHTCSEDSNRVDPGADLLIGHVFGETIRAQQHDTAPLPDIHSGHFGLGPRHRSRSPARD